MNIYNIVKVRDTPKEIEEWLTDLVNEITDKMKDVDLKKLKQLNAVLTVTTQRKEPL